jgi:hypothetical protein
MNTRGAKTNMEEQVLASGDSIRNIGVGNTVLETDHGSFLGNTASNIYNYYETKVSSLIRKYGILEAQLAASLANQEVAEKNLASANKSRQEMDKKFADTVKEIELLREKLAGAELAQEEANNLSNIVHSDNVRLEHDVAFLKAVLEDTQKVYMTFHLMVLFVCLQNAIIDEENLVGIALDKRSSSRRKSQGIPITGTSLEIGLITNLSLSLYFIYCVHNLENRKQNKN